MAFNIKRSTPLLQNSLFERSTEKEEKRKLYLQEYTETWGHLYDNFCYGLSECTMMHLYEYDKLAVG